MGVQADRQAEEFTAFVRETGTQLHRAAMLLTGDHHLAEDLTQATYAKVFVHWRRVASSDSPLAYARTTLLNTFLSHRRLRRNSERPTDLPVSVDTPGWTCESFPVDEKMWCQSGNLGVSVVVRGAGDYDDWQGSPDKESSALWMSPVHGNYFVTLQGGENGLSPTQLDAFIAGITFADSWQRP